MLPNIQSLSLDIILKDATKTLSIIRKLTYFIMLNLLYQWGYLKLRIFLPLFFSLNACMIFSLYWEYLKVFSILKVTHSVGICRKFDWFSCLRVKMLWWILIRLFQRLSISRCKTRKCKLITFLFPSMIGYAFWREKYHLRLSLWTSI